MAGLTLLILYLILIHVYYSNKNDEMELLISGIRELYENSAILSIKQITFFWSITQRIVRPLTVIGHWEIFVNTMNQYKILSYIGYK